jgi:BirA family transcriptional regulator, biotin operon repressor / biotin---[acetyl-CoA-carboxylase] ligase
MAVPMNFTILRFDRVGSTNTEAAAQARNGAGEGLCVIAFEQTAGRGRRGRAWISERGSGLYFSVVLRPKLEMRFLPLLTLMAGVAVHDTLAEFGVDADIKWVNDLLADEKKIGGILSETIETNAGIAVVVGIGINLRFLTVPDEIAETSTSIEAQTGRQVESDQAAEILTRYLSYFYDILSRPDGQKAIVDQWRRRSTYFSGKDVRVTLSDGSFAGVTCGLEDNGALRVRTADGSIIVVQAGDVERLRSKDAAPAAGRSHNII